MSLLLHDYGVNYKALDVVILVGTIILVTYVAYKEEVKRHYPLLKVIGVNLLGVVSIFCSCIYKDRPVVSSSICFDSFSYKIQMQGLYRV